MNAARHIIIAILIIGTVATGNGARITRTTRREVAASTVRS
jgi:hypothetical protein